MSAKGDANRSVRHTKERILKGFLKLLKEKPMKEITVSELVNSIDMNRGTFYFHYKDIYDLLEQLENDVLYHLEQIFESSEQSSVSIITELFIMLKENREFCEILLGSNGDIAFMNRIKKLSSDEIMKFLNQTVGNLNCIDPTFDYINSYIINGFLGIVEIWISTGMKQSPEDMTKFTAGIIEASMGTFLQNNGMLLWDKNACPEYGQIFMKK